MRVGENTVTFNGSQKIVPKKMAVAGTQQETVGPRGLGIDDTCYIPLEKCPTCGKKQ
jgi:hypothetical protein